MRECPICGIKYLAPPAISRRDNETEICPRCGVREALEDLYNNVGKGEIYEKVVKKAQSQKASE